MKAGFLPTMSSGISLVPLILAVLFISCRAPAESPQEPVATVGSFEISDAHFSNQLRHYYLRTGQALNLNEAVRLAVVNARLERYTIVEHAREQGWAYDADAVYNKALIERKVLMEEYERRLVHAQVQVTEPDLREIFRRFNTRIRASHLYAPTRQEAMALYVALQQGADFEVLARQTFKDPALAANGGDLGYFTIDEMDVAFEDAAYRMPIGAFSEPVRTSQGYSIIKVTDILQDPVLTETEFASKIHALRPVALQQLQELATRRDLAEATAAFSLNEPVFSELWDLVQQNRASYETASAELNEIPLPVDDVLRKSVLLTFSGVPFTVQQWLTEAYYTLPARRESLRSVHDFREQVEGMAYRSFAMRRIRNHPAKDAEFVQGSIDETFYSYLFERFERYLDGQVTVDESEKRAEYRINGSFYEHPVQLNLAEMGIKDRDLASELFVQLQQGASFETLLHTYGAHSESSGPDGALGYIPITKFGVMQTGLAGIQPGGYAGPFQVAETEFIIFKCLGRKEASPMTESEALEAIGERLFYLKRETMRNALISDAKTRYKASINMEKLNSITFEI